MNAFPIKTPLNVQWHFKKPGGEAFSLGGLKYVLKYRTSRGESLAGTVLLTGVDRNILSWIFPAQEQNFTGVYDLLLELYEPVGDGWKPLCTASYQGAFSLEKATSGCCHRTAGIPIDGSTVETPEEQLVVLHSVAEWWLYTPMTPVAGPDGFWYINGEGTRIPTHYRLEWDEDERLMYVTVGEGDEKSVVSVIPAVRDALDEIDNQVMNWSLEEQRRDYAENQRQYNESARQTAEEIRVTAEGIRHRREDDRYVAEEIRKNEEATRQGNEEDRIREEVVRRYNEMVRQQEFQKMVDKMVTVPMKNIRILDNDYYYKVFPYRFRSGSVPTYFGTVGAPEDEDILIRLPDDYFACKVIVPLAMEYSSSTTASSYVVTDFDEYSGADLERISYKFNGDRYVVIAAGTGVILHWPYQACRVYVALDQDDMARCRIGENSLLRTAYVKAVAYRYLIASESSTSTDSYVFKWMASGNSPAQYQPYIDVSKIPPTTRTKALAGLVIDIEN